MFLEPLVPEIRSRTDPSEQYTSGFPDIQAAVQDYSYAANLRSWRAQQPTTHPEAPSSLDADRCMQPLLKVRVGTLL